MILFQLIIVSAVFVYAMSLLYVNTVFSKEIDTFQVNNLENLFNVNSPVGSFMFVENAELSSSITGRVISFNLSLPLKEEDYYGGKFTNAKSAVKAFNEKLNILYPGEEVKLVYGQYITLSPSEGYVMTEFGQGSGSCWTVSVLGGLIDDANTYWIREYGFPLFIIEESHPHSEIIESYGNVNEGYGYNIFYEQDEDGIWRDFVFKVNPESSSVVSVIVFDFFSSNNDNNAYNGEAVGGKLFVLIK